MLNNWFQILGQSLGQANSCAVACMHAYTPAAMPHTVSGYCQHLFLAPAPPRTSIKGPASTCVLTQAAVRPCSGVSLRSATQGRCPGAGLTAKTALRHVVASAAESSSTGEVKLCNLNPGCTAESGATLSRNSLISFTEWPCHEIRAHHVGAAGSKAIFI